MQKQSIFPHVRPFFSQTPGTFLSTSQVLRQHGDKMSVSCLWLSPGCCSEKQGSSLNSICPNLSIYFVLITRLIEEDELFSSNFLSLNKTLANELVHLSFLLLPPCFRANPSCVKCLNIEESVRPVSE